MSRSIMLLLALSTIISICSAAEECSTEKANGDCQITIDRRYPVALPTIQIRKKSKVTVVVINPLAYEALSLDAQSAQAVPGTDQTSGLFTSALSSIKGIVFSVRTTALPPPPPPPPPPPVTIGPEEQKVQDDLKQLERMKSDATSQIDGFFGDATVIYLQLQEVLAAMPRPLKPNSGDPVRAPEIETRGTPLPWVNFPGWKTLVLCELAGGQCAGSGVVERAPRFQAALTALAPTDSANAKPSSILDVAAFGRLVDTTKVEIDRIPDPSRRGTYSDQLNALNAWEKQLIVAAPSYTSAAQSIAKDLSGYLASILQLRDSTPEQSVALGVIFGPGAPGGCAKAILGCQTVFGVNAVNQVAASVASVPGQSQKKNLVNITLVFADSIFEVSSGVFFSTLPNRSFANQTAVVQNLGAVPTTGNVTLAQTLIRPEIIPFAAANWRLWREGLWPDSRRRAYYATVAIGLNPYNTTAEFGAGLSVSWRNLMFSGLFHWGHDLRLTQGEYVGEVWCNQSAAEGSIPKCSGNPPNPSTQRYWTSAFGFGIGIRVPTIFGPSSH